MEPSKSAGGAYDWMLGLSAEGWAWEFLRRNPDYRQAYVACTLVGNLPNPYEAAACWGLLTVCRQNNWDSCGPSLREHWPHLLVDLKRRSFGEASVFA
jgi:hypothetical protein